VNLFVTAMMAKQAAATLGFASLPGLHSDVDACLLTF
jgi:hypothetical protein